MKKKIKKDKWKLRIVKSTKDWLNTLKHGDELSIHITPNVFVLSRNPIIEIKKNKDYEHATNVKKIVDV